MLKLSRFVVRTLVLLTQYTGTKRERKRTSPACVLWTGSSFQSHKRWIHDLDQRSGLCVQVRSLRCGRFSREQNRGRRLDWSYVTVWNAPMAESRRLAPPLLRLGACQGIKLFYADDRANQTDNPRAESNGCWRRAERVPYSILRDDVFTTTCVRRAP